MKTLIASLFVRGAALLPLIVLSLLTGLPVAPAIAAGQASVRAADLRCEYLVDPLGLDVRQPRLSWRLVAHAPRSGGQCQTAYRLLVASSADVLKTGRGDLWDSGLVTSAACQLIPYAGQPLRSNQRCLWKVQVQDERGRWSAWSAPASWGMGLLEPGDWTAKWIGQDQVFVKQKGWPPPDNTLPDPWFRKGFSLDARPARAVAYVASIGYHELYVNGKKVGDTVLEPSVTDHSKRARYVAYDVTDHLQPGRNVVGFWLGYSWSIFPNYVAPGKPATPIVIAQVELTTADGRTQRWGTDETWKTHPSPNTTIGVWDFMHYGGELYDANREVPNWNAASLDDSAWKAVTVYQPQVLLSAQKVEPNRRVHGSQPVAITEPTPGVYRVDFGVNFAGLLEATISAAPGSRVEFKWSEDPKTNWTHRLHSYYVMGPSGKGTFRNRFNYGSGRWLEITGLNRKPELGDLRGWLVRTDYTRATEFECSNPLLNRIYATTLWTFENLSLGGYVVDCPQRERMGYGGDAHATTETALDNYRLGAFYTKWSEDWRDVQGKEAAWGTGRQDGQAEAGKKVEAGNLPYTAPTYWGGGGPAWSGYCVTLPWELYRRYGDRRALEDNWLTIQKWLAFLETKAKNDLLVRWGGEWDFLGDWLWPGARGVNGDTRETLFFNNCYWVGNLQTAAQIADALGQRDAARAYQQRADAVRTAIHKEFFVPDRNSYVNGLQAYLSAALLAGVPPADVRPAVWRRLEDEIRVVRKGHFWGGITGGYFIIKNLIAADKPELMYEMASQEDYPSWGDMLKRGATTLWEDWEGEQSLLHSSYLHLGAWFVEGLAGIQPGPDGKGYQDFVICPGLWKGSPLDSLRCRFDSPYGPIESRWRRAGQKWRLAVQVPPNTQATLLLPARDNAAIASRDKALVKAKAAATRDPATGRLRLAIGPGWHELELSE